VKRAAVVAALSAVLLLPCAAARACPVCDTGTGEAVRAGLFDAAFAGNLAGVLLPFPVLLALAALTYYGPPAPPRWRRGRGKKEERPAHD
jgi:hypothetical protein